MEESSGGKGSEVVIESGKKTESRKQKKKSGKEPSQDKAKMGKGGKKKEEEKRVHYVSWQCPLCNKTVHVKQNENILEVRVNALVQMAEHGNKTKVGRSPRWTNAARQKCTKERRTSVQNAML